MKIRLTNLILLYDSEDQKHKISPQSEVMAITVQRDVSLMIFY